MHIMANVTYISCIFLLGLILHAVNAEYCTQKHCGTRHTKCRFPTHIPGEKCKKVHFVGLTLGEINTILRMHNKFRNTVANGWESRGSPGPQPPARNIKRLKWDNELALIAQRWAIQCEVDNDVCRHVDRFRVGQNVAYAYTTGAPHTINIKDMVRVWYDQVKYFNNTQVDRVTKFTTEKGKKLNHYIQLVSAKTKFVGCGAMRYKHGRKHKMLLVCNYGPSGRRFGKRLYRRA